MTCTQKCITIKVPFKYYKHEHDVIQVKCVWMNEENGGNPSGLSNSESFLFKHTYILIVSVVIIFI